MDDKIKKEILDAFLVVMRPIVRILLRFGISYGGFAEAVKTVFVDVASSDFGIRGRPTNISRVAVMTGLTRKEVKRLRNKIENGEEGITVKSTPMAQILHYWHAEDDFIDKNGRPATLSFSDGEFSFTELVRRFGGDVPPGAMRTELKRVGSVSEHPDGSLSVISRVVLQKGDTDNLVTGLVHCAYPLLSTIAANTDPNLTHEGYAQFSTYSLRIDEAQKKRLRRISYDRLSEAAVSFDDLFIAYESLTTKTSSGGGGVNGPAVVVGLYYFEERDQHAKYKW